MSGIIVTLLPLGSSMRDFTSSTACLSTPQPSRGSKTRQFINIKPGQCHWMQNVRLRYQDGYWQWHFTRDSLKTAAAKNRVSVGVHHLLCWWLHGPPPAGKALACHNTCGNRGCINVRHISWGDQADNALQAIAHRAKARRARGSVQPAVSSEVTLTQQIGVEQKRRRAKKGSRFD